MIDTATLSVPTRKIVTDPIIDRIGSKWHLQRRTPGYDMYIRNPSAAFTKQNYFPYVTAFNRKGSHSSWKEAESTIHFRFSAPKLIFQNNVDELTEDQFEAVVRALTDRLREMNILVRSQTLADAEVRTVHYSKNIELHDGYTARYVINELGKIDMSKRFDFGKARYENDGSGIVAHTKAHEFVVYDKIADMGKSQKRAIDKDQTSRQPSLFADFEKAEKPHEIIRFEIRLNEKRKIDALFQELGFAPNPTFKDAFSAAKSKKVVRHYWDTMVTGHAAALFGHTLTMKELLHQIMLAEKNMRPKEAIYRAAAIFMAREGNGLRELRSILQRRGRDDFWYDLTADVKKTTTKLDKLRPRDWFDQIIKGFEVFESLRVVHLLGKQK